MKDDGFPSYLGKNVRAWCVCVCTGTHPVWRGRLLLCLALERDERSRLPPDLYTDMAVCPLSVLPLYHFVYIKSNDAT